MSNSEEEDAEPRPTAADLISNLNMEVIHTEHIVCVRFPDNLAHALL